MTSGITTVSTSKEVYFDRKGQTMSNDVVVEREVPYVERRPRRGFLWGVLFAVAAIVAAAGIYLAVSDDDSDGRIQVPTVDVDVDADPAGG